MLRVSIDGRQIEYRLCPGDASRPPLVFLHEGLGCVALWRDFPDVVARRLGTRALVYSRFGYGGSDGLTAPRTETFMHTEALEVLPKLLDHFGLERPLLIGHSDGASIALIHAATASRPVSGLVLLAPHIVAEPMALQSIAKVRERYLNRRPPALRDRLSRYHAHVDDAFLGWADTWLSPGFRHWSLEALCEALTAPALLVQGEKDEYGTVPVQIDGIASRAKGVVERLILSRCGHAPHRDQEAAVTEAIEQFWSGTLACAAR